LAEQKDHKKDYLKVVPRAAQMAVQKAVLRVLRMVDSRVGQKAD